MSTRSHIGISTVEEGISYVKYVYCHFDGYTIDGVGQMLFEHYKDEEKVKELISLGDISFLEKNIEPSKDSNHSFYTPEKDVTVFYHRDRKENLDNSKARKISDLKYYPDDMVDYIYLFENNQWYLIEKIEKDGNVKLTKTLVKDIIKKT